MSYKIRYGPDTRQEIQSKRRETGTWPWLILFGLIIFVGAIWPQGRDVMRQILFPWANEITAAAFQEMIHRIGSGTSVPAAVMEFCREIIENARILVCASI